MKTQDVILEFAKNKGFKIWDKVNFKALENEIILSECGIALLKLYNHGSDDIDKIVEKRNDFILFKPKSSIDFPRTDYNNLIIGRTKLFHIEEFAAGSKLNFVAEKTAINDILEVTCKSFIISESSGETNCSLNEKWLPAWKEVYDILVQKFETENVSNQLRFEMLREAMEAKTIESFPINMRLSSAQGLHEIKASTNPIIFQMGYYHNNKFVERFNSGDGQSGHYSPSYFIKMLKEDVKIYDYSIKILGY